MNRKTLSLLAVAAAAVAVTSACGGPATPAAPSAAPSSSAPSSSAPSSSAPSTGTESSAPAPSESSTSGGNDSAKPSKDEIKTGLAKFYETKQNLPADKAKKFANCMVDQMYDKATTATLVAMRDGDPTKADTKDAGLLGKSAMACQSALS